MMRHCIMKKMKILSQNKRWVHKKRLQGGSENSDVGGVFTNEERIKGPLNIENPMNNLVMVYITGTP